MESMDGEQDLVINLAILRSRVYAHLINTFRFQLSATAVDDELPIIRDYLQIISNKELTDAFGEYEREVVGLTDEKVEDLEYEFNRLFIGPGPLAAPPYGSVYTSSEKIVFGPSTMEVRETYDKHGLESFQPDKEPEDHITLELEFLLVLQNRLIDRLEDRELDVVSANLEEQRQFLQSSILNWSHQFCDKIMGQTKSPYFRTLAHFTDMFLKSDVESIFEFGQAIKTITCAQMDN